MSNHIYPIALLHTITVDTFYRGLSHIINTWKRAVDVSIMQRLSLSSWRTIHRANHYGKVNVMELRRVLEHTGKRDSTVSPLEAKALSLLNKNPSIV